MRVTYETGTGERVDADVVDLGGGGVFIRTAAPMPVGKRIALEIQVVGESGPWSALGRVVWTRETGGGDKAPPGMGVKLIDADDTVLAAIARIVETREPTEPGVGGSTPPPPQPIIAVAPERERTLMGVGASEDAPAPPAPAAPDGAPAEVPTAPREASIAIDLVAAKSLPATVPPAAAKAATRPEEKTGGAGRLVVILLLLVVAAVAAYVLLDGFLRPAAR